MKAPVRQDLSPRSPEVAQIAHGERVELLERRRRFFRIRTAKGVMGWMDSRQLMNAAQLEAIARQSASHRNTPAVAQATVYEPLNVHSDPNRQAPSFTQIPERGIVDVLLYQLAPRVPYKFPPLIEERKPEPRPSRKKGKKVEKANEVPPPPPPDAPEPPEDWIEISKTERNEPLPADAPKMDDWTLVRVADGRTGWVLSGMLVMAIPDEVAQYSEGHRIMGYWPLGEVVVDGVKHNHWLWVTQSQKNVPFAFDGFRIFMYAARRKRYEQAYREKNIEGQFPVDVVRPGRKKEYLAEFSIVSRRDPSPKAIRGSTPESAGPTRRTFAFLGYQVLKLDEQPYTPAPVSVDRPSAATVTPETPPAKSESWRDRILPR